MNAMLANDPGDFRPDLAVGVLTLVPLILITSVLNLGILRRWSGRLRSFESGGAAARNGQIALRYALFVGCGMCVASVTAIVMALVELNWQTNNLDDAIFGCSVAVTLGVGVAITGNIIRALVFGDFARNDVSDS
jgi:hypothetical protein